MRSVVTELLAYADESGTHSDPSYCVVAGWIGSARQWHLFDDAWKAVLEEYGVPDFHAGPFFSRKNMNPSRANPYQGWSDDHAARFINSLVEVIAARRLNPVGGAVDIPAFMSYTKAERRYFTNGPLTLKGKFKGPITGSPNKPYQLGVMLFMTEAAQAAKADSVVRFVFDRNSVEEGYAVSSFNRINERQRNPLWAKLGAISFADRKGQIGLQAADLYAHLWYTFLERDAVGMGAERHRVWQGVKKRRDWMRVADSAVFEPLLSKLTPVQRDALRISPLPTDR